ncbi:transposase, partial [Bacteroides sp. 3_1_40A]
NTKQKSQRVALLREGAETQRTEMHRTGSRVRTNEKQYEFKRFRHFGKDKVFMDFAFFAIAFNIKKMCAKMTKEGMDWLIRPFYELTVVLFRC